MTISDLKNSTDGELIKEFTRLRGRSDLAMRELVGRHHEQMYARFLAKVKNESDAHDLEQELWIRVARNLHLYKDEGKFEHYLSKIASNIVIDFYRKSGRDKEVMVDTHYGNAADDDVESGWHIDQLESPGQNVEEQLRGNDLAQYLSNVLIPALPVEQRTAWLLRHESEYWEQEQRLEWRHMAELNNMSEEDVSTVFEVARNKLMSGNGNAQAAPVKLDELETLVFLIWTQAQRLDKSTKFTWDYFAEVLGQPVNTMKTRYRAAQKALNKGLSEYMQS